MLPLGGVSLIGKILILILGVYGVVHFFYEKDKKEIFSKINKYILSFPVAILFAVLLSLHFLFCSAGTVIVAMMKGVYSVALYLFGFVVPLIIISLVAYILGAKNEEAIDRIRFLRLIGGIILVLIVIL
ncbi:hypothetical protein DRN98_10220 [Methanosarcinales archaeon]|nr:MAG: hypothetical protein DRN98_10220 [Methanosarcinales archaeon]